MATERLRKRLANEYKGGENNVEVNENFCLIGTPLPNIFNNKKKDLNEYKPEWQQEVYDDQGRRRFHGAFTGGWSAGYYNTVGSKEGWTPTSFRSSRKDKEKQVGNEKEHGEKKEKFTKTTAEDFMDEEDLENFRERRGDLKVNDSINAPNNSQPDPFSTILGLEQNPKLIHSSQESTSNISLQQTSIGTRLLQRMGWKSGQGLGPWLKAGRLARLRSIFGLQGKLKLSKEDKAKTHPPPDTLLVQSVPNRIGSQGLGWQDFEKPATLSELLKRRHHSEQNKNHSSKEGRGGFGIGALEQDSDDEDEVYNSGLQVEDSTLVSRSRKGNEKAENGDERIANPTSFKNKENDGKNNAWNDGRPMISGFVLSLNPLKEDNWSEAPLVPKDWQPNPQRVWGTISTSSNSRTHHHTGTQLGSKERASMFGEARIPGPPPLITDYLSVKDQERLQRFKVGNSQKTPFEIPTIDENVARAALQGFIPFGNDLDKQERYREYLKSQIDHSLQQLRPDNGQTHEEFERELREFSKSATMFKPMNTMMASRFESSSISERNDTQKLAPGLFQPSLTPLPSKEEVEDDKREAEKQKEDLINQELQSLTPFQRNARMGLFGPNTTRETKKWVPARLLCKRLNVPLPYPDEMVAIMEDKIRKGKDEEMFDEFGESKGKHYKQITNVNARWEASKRELQQLAANRSWEGQEGNEKSSLMARSEIENNDDHTKFDLANVGLGAIKDTTEDEYVKPPLTLFKEIFAEDEGSVIDSQTVEEQATDSQSDAPPTPASVPRLLFKPRKRSEIEEGEQTSVKKKKVEKSKMKGKLTFNMDDDEEFNNSFPKKRDVNSTKSRLKASDLF